jgi:hypothetical protein
VDFGQSMPLNTTIGILTSQGQVVKQITVPDKGKSMRVDVSGLPEGFYLIRVASSGAPVVKKVAVIH